MHSDFKDPLLELTSELENFQQIATYLLPKPGDLPRIAGFDIYGGTLPLTGSVGGDLVIYVDFKERFDLDGRIQRCCDEGRHDIAENLRRCRSTAGIAVIDVSGHRVTDAVLAVMLHQAFLLGAVYELDMFGQVTNRLFENLNTRVYESSAEHRFVSLTYGEISDDARFRFLSAAQPVPLVFSNSHDRFMDVREDLCASAPPLGMVPSRHVTDPSRTASALGLKDAYTINQWVLMGEGDILLLHTDGLVEHTRGGDDYCPVYLEETLRRVKDRTAAEIFEAIKADLLAFAPPGDDVSFVVIKKQ